MLIVHLLVSGCHLTSLCEGEGDEVQQAGDEENVQGIQAGT